jgi:hypothetical protein
MLETSKPLGELLKLVDELSAKGYLPEVEPTVPRDPFDDILALDRTKIQRRDLAADRRLKRVLGRV